MSETVPTSYDQVPYESWPFKQTHPGTLAVIGSLLGLKPPRIDRCRVLELGCAAGGNLIPMALTLPESTFTGIDLSARQIDDGQKTVAALRLSNIQLQHLSILDVGPDFGRFDYIICHGVYSWVPAGVQDKILDICKQHLAPNGIAYVSFNSYPGWHMRAMIRDMMCYHARQFTEPLFKVKQARNLLDFLAKSVTQEKTPYGLLLKSELEALRRCSDAYLFHEQLEVHNEPIYFYQFAERLAAKGLRYLGEADLRVMVPGNYPAEVENVLQMFSPDHIHLEQYMDFLRNRMFRQTLLCHQHITPNYALRAERLQMFHVASPARPVSAQPDIRSSEFEQFTGPDEVSLKSRDPLTKAAMLTLAEIWPCAMPFDELRATARKRLGANGPTDTATIEEDIQALGQSLLQCYTSGSAGLVELYVVPPRFTVEVSERPRASPLARLQAETGPTVTNLRHETVMLDEFSRHMLRHLDGSRDRAALLRILVELVTTGDLIVEQHGRPVEDSERIQLAANQGLDEQLPRLARRALLIG